MSNENDNVDTDLNNSDNDSNSGGDTNDTQPVSMEDTIRSKYKEITSRGDGDGDDSANRTVQQQNTGNKPKVAVTDTQTTPEYPSSWRKNGSLDTKWATLDPEVRDEILKRETDMRAGIEQYKDRAGYAETIYNMFQPYQAIFNKEGLGHKQFVQEMLNTSYKLYAGSPEEKVLTLIGLAQRNGVNLEGLVQSVSNMAVGKNAVDPAVLQLQQQLANVTNAQQNWTQQQQNAQFQQQVNTVNAFAAEPANKYINEPGVKDIMATLVESGQAKSLQDAYDKACGAIPEVRTKLFAEQQEGLNKTAAEKAAKAKNASSTNVKTTGKHTGNKVQKVGTIEDTIRNTYRDIMGRNG